MRAVRRFWCRLLGCFAGARRESDLARELESHIQLMVDDLVCRGLSPKEARRQALLAFGGVEATKERYREQRGLPWLDATSRDIRLVLRGLARTPALALIIVVTLGLAVGANTAIFSLVDRVALRPLPVDKPEELVRLSAPPLPYWGNTMNAGGGKLSGLDYPLIRNLRDGLPHVFSATAIWRKWRFTLALEDGAIDVGGEFVNADYFRVYNLRPLAGRTLAAADDDRPDATPVVVLNHAFWMQQFGGDRSILNRTLRLNKTPVTVVGILAPGYAGSDPSRVPQVFLPLGAAAQVAPVGLPGTGMDWNSPALRIYVAVTRLRPGVDRTSAERALRARYQVLLDDAIAGKGGSPTPKGQEFYATHKPTLLPAGYVGSLGSSTTRTYDLPLRLLLAMTLLVLVVATGNVANLLLARGAGRQHEVAVSYALGAQRWHLLRPLLLESLLLGLAAAAAGLLLSAWTGSLLPTLLGLESDLAGIDTTPDRRVVVFTLAVSFAVALLIWLSSAFTFTGRRGRASLLPTRPLGEGGRSALVLRRGLVVAQVAFSLALLCTSALFARSLANILSVDPGFDARGLLACAVNLGPAGYEGGRRQAFVGQLLEEVRAVPGVTRVTATSVLPLTGGLSGAFVEGPRQAAGRGSPVLVDVVCVGTGFFDTMGQTMAVGRGFDGRDQAGAPLVAVVNDSLARLLVDTGTVVGQRIGYERMARDTTVVGVVRDVRTRSLKAPSQPTLFLPAAQAAGSDTFVLMRAAGPGALNAKMVRAIVGRLDSAVAVTEVRSVERFARDRLLRERMLAGFSLLFAGLSAVLAALGLVGVASFSVATRSREFAVRLAVGASRARVAGLVFGEVGALALVGGGLGLAIFLAWNRVLRSLLFEVSTNDPVAIGAAVLALTATACLAGAWPARRAARLDPAVTLRAE